MPIVLIVTLLVSVQTAAIHPLGNFTISHLSEDQVTIHYALNLAEIPSFQKRDEFDPDGDATISAKESRGYVDATLPSLVEATLAGTLPENWQNAGEGSGPLVHDHSDRDHAHSQVPPSNVATRGRMALGISGGIVPYPSALILLLNAMSLDRLELGVVLVITAALVAIELLVVYTTRRLRVGFTSGVDTALAARYEASILDENITCERVATPLPDADSRLGRVARRLLGAGTGDLPADEIALPCRPYATDEQIQQAVLAVMKAAHAIEFDLTLETERLNAAD